MRRSFFCSLTTWRTSFVFVTGTPGSLSFLPGLLSSWTSQEKRRRTRLSVVLVSCFSLKNLDIHHISHHFVYHCCSIRDSLYLILRIVDVSSKFRRRRLRALNKRCLICSQNLLINVSCLCFFIHCLNEICRRDICNWMSWTCVFASRIYIEIVLKLSLIWRRFCCCSLMSFFVAATTLFERSCDAC
jgi:hypothetical protein